MFNEKKIDIMLESQIKYSEKLWKEKEELQQRIDKAIDKIKNIPMLVREREELLEILGDKANE